MQISRINFTSYSTNVNLKAQIFEQRKKNSCQNDLKNVPAISFYGFNLPVRKPELTKDISKKIVTKFQNFPKSSRVPAGKCLLFEVCGKKYAMRIDKCDNNKMFLVVKDNVEKVEDFDNSQNSKETIRCIFNKEGYMVSGEFFRKMNPHYTKKFLFTNESDNKRRIEIDAMRYRPLIGDKNGVWHKMNEVSSSYATEKVNFKKEYANTDFAELFFELAGPRTTIL